MHRGHITARMTGNSINGIIPMVLGDYIYLVLLKVSILATSHYTACLHKSPLKESDIINLIHHLCYAYNLLI